MHHPCIPQIHLCSFHASRVYSTCSMPVLCINHASLKFIYAPTMHPGFTVHVPCLYNASTMHCFNSKFTKLHQPCILSHIKHHLCIFFSKGVLGPCCSQHTPPLSVKSYSFEPLNHHPYANDTHIYVSITSAMVS